MLNPHHILGVSSNAGPKEIRQAYCRLLKRLHPDVSAQDPGKRELLHQVISAYRQLKRIQANAHPAARSAPRLFGWTGIAFAASLVCALLAVLEFYVRVVPSVSPQLSVGEPGIKQANATDPDAAATTPQRWTSNNIVALEKNATGRVGQSLQPHGYVAGAGALTHSGVMASEVNAAPLDDDFALVQPNTGPVLQEPNSVFQIAPTPAIPRAPAIAPISVVASIIDNPEPEAVLAPLSQHPPNMPQRTTDITSIDVGTGELIGKSILPFETVARTIPFPTRNGGMVPSQLWRVYRDRRFDISISYPQKLLPDRKWSKDSKDRLFSARDGKALLRVITESAPEDGQLAQDMSKRIAKRYGGIPIETELFDNGYLLRGSYGGEIFLERFDRSCSARFSHRTLLVYPAGMKQEFEVLAEKLISNTIVRQNSKRSCAATASHSSR
ncbi:MAG: DnaJ domain-containing protein [Hyphomicrobiaceae bacterium]